MTRVIVIGLDGLEPTIVDAMLAAGELPHLQTLKARGGYSTIATTYPAQTPVAWSTFATGTNPGGHGIFDFIRRDPNTYLPDVALNRYEARSFLPPRAVNLRHGTPVWQVLSDAGIPSSVLRCPCTYPPDPIKGRLLSGLGVPDVRGGFGTATLYTSATGISPGEGESIQQVEVNGTIETDLIGPRKPRQAGDCRFPITIEVRPQARTAVIRSAGDPGMLQVSEREWSDFIRVRFKLGPMQSITAITRFFLASVEPFELYASPLNFDPAAPMFPVSTPPDYARELAEALGMFHTIGFAEEHRGLNNERFDEHAFLQQCNDVFREREQMMLYELDRFTEGLFFCLFDTPDRIQHMFWRFLEDGHPANRVEGHRSDAADLRQVIRQHYRRCDEVVGAALSHADDETLVMVLSDHGMTGFQRGVHLNTWLHDHGLLALKPGSRPGDEEGADFFRNVDWGRTAAYSLGLGGIYLNLQGRERDGIVKPDAAGDVKRTILEGLSGLIDSERGCVAIRHAVTREQVYSGSYLTEAPDVLVGFNRGYRASWSTTLGGTPAGLFEDNVKKWGGDHIVDPALVPGVLFMNRPFDARHPGLIDLAPTILKVLGTPRHPAMEGASLL